MTATRSLVSADLAAELAEVPPPPAWRGRETLGGHGVMNLPFSSGHQLGLRVFPHSPLGGYVSVWHRDPDGAWAQYVDARRVEDGCPRYWGPALSAAALASIDVTWAAPMTCG